MDVGIIGGQDGPTAILISSSPIALPFMLLILAGLVGAAWFFLHKRKKEGANKWVVFLGPFPSGT